MTKEQVKAEVTKTLQKVELQELPAVIRQIRLKALFNAMFNRLSDETFDAINEACNEFDGVQK